MSIVIVTGAAKTGKTLIANALRNNQISQRFGALLVDEDQKGELRHQIEKLINGMALPVDEDGSIVAPKNLKELPWKENSMVIVVSKTDEGADKVLGAFDEALPGFSKLLGPVYTVQAGKG